MERKLHIPYPIVVEGKYDRQRLLCVADATILTTDGFGIFKKAEKAALIRALAAKSPLIVLTDSDGAGKLIRSRLSGILPPDKIISLYVPRIPGKEKRKAAPGKEGKLGVEGMTPEIILTALRNAGATIEGETEKRTAGAITKADLMALGLAGTSGSEEKRKKLMKHLDFPEHMSPNALLQALNLLFSLEELETILDTL